MASIKAYKFVNPGVAASASPAVAAARTQTLALNRLGATVSSISSILADVEKVSIIRSKTEQQELIAERRRKRREEDAAAEEAAEVNKLRKKDQKPELTSTLKKGAQKSLGWIDKFLGPIGSFLLNIGGFFVTKSLLEWIGDRENLDKLATFFEKAKFVFEKLFGWAKTLTSTTLDGFSNLFGANSDFGERLKGLGQIMMGIIGLKYLMNPFSLITDILGLVDLLQSAKPRQPDGTKPRKPTDIDSTKPPKPTQSNPSGANPDVDGPRGRPAASTVKGQYGDAAEAAYKKILKERGEDAARVFLNELDNTGGNVTKAQQRFNRFVNKGKFPKIEPPKPNLGQRIFGGLQSLAEGAKDLTMKGLSGLGKLAQEQFARLSNAGKAAWQKTVAGTQALSANAQKWASIQADKFKKGAAALGEKAKNALFQKVLEPLRPIIDTVGKQAKKVGEAIMGALQKIPGFDKVIKFLKSKGIAGLDAIAGAGSKLGKRASTIIPVVGGLVNLAFAYDRAANGDSIGALLEGTSGILDIAGLFTGGTTSVASMMIDGYMFARDFLPFLQDSEEKIINGLGLGGFKQQIDQVLSKLPNLGEIIGMISGQPKEPQQAFLGGVIKNIGNAVSGFVNNPVVKTAAAVIPGAAPVMAGIGALSGLASGNPMAALSEGIRSFVPSPFNQIGSSLLSGNFIGAATTGAGMISPNIGQLAGSILGNGLNPMSMIGGLAQNFGLGNLYKAVTGVMGNDYTTAMRMVGTELGVDPKVLGVASTAGNQILSNKGFSAEYAMQQTMEFIPVPMIVEKLVPIPQAVPINTSGGVVEAIPSSTGSRMR